ncbi:MAG: response regulator [Elusimicrobia bacterium]|nr:response regulator [Elusimicrobiota bacterium]
MNVIIADDDQNLLAMLVPHLEHSGHKAELAANGGELLKKIKEKRFDLIISDINMPVFDGVEVYCKARAMHEYAAAPFILWSGLESAKGQALAKADHKLRFLKKPFSLAALHKAIDEITDLPYFGDYGPAGGKPGIKL